MQSSKGFIRGTAVCSCGSFTPGILRLKKKRKLSAVQYNTFEAEGRGWVVESLPGAMQVRAVVPHGVGVEIIELHDGRALRTLVNFRHLLPADGAEILVSA